MLQAYFLSLKCGVIFKQRASDESTMDGLITIHKHRPIIPVAENGMHDYQDTSKGVLNTSYIEQTPQLSDLDHQPLSKSTPKQIQASSRMAEFVRSLPHLPSNSLTPP
jgi:hypothetical protein